MKTRVILYPSGKRQAIPPLAPLKVHVWDPAEHSWRELPLRKADVQPISAGLEDGMDYYTFDLPEGCEEPG